MKIFQKIQHSFQKKQPFVVYRKPNSVKIEAFFQKNDSLYFLDDFSTSGFVFAPFQIERKPVFFPLQQSDFFSENDQFSSQKLLNTTTETQNSNKEFHIQIVQKAIDEIQKGTFKKVVLSRKELIHLSDFELIAVYQKLLQKYQTAFVYVWFHPAIGLWLGATPETLLTIHNLNFVTMSLAGTQVATNFENVVWHQKELEEQLLVTQFIENQLKNVATNIQKTPVETVKAGNLFHLKTVISGVLNSQKSTIKELILSLHPTPAICGLPRNEALNFILANEHYDREFYTGFLGELNVKSDNENSITSNLFVNLRCMKIEEKTAHIFVGGGITKDSNPEKEWLETVSKSNTMKSVL